MSMQKVPHKNHTHKTHKAHKHTNSSLDLSNADYATVYLFQNVIYMVFYMWDSCLWKKKYMIYPIDNIPSEWFSSVVRCDALCFTGAANSVRFFGAPSGTKWALRCTEMHWDALSLYGLAMAWRLATYRWVYHSLPMYGCPFTHRKFIEPHRCGDPMGPHTSTDALQMPRLRDYVPVPNPRLVLSWEFVRTKKNN